MIQKQLCQNGVRIIHEKMPYVRSLAIGLFVKAGSVHETEQEWGLSHFIEHMLFKGTSTRTAKMIAEQFDRMGGDMNAYTSKEMTCYYATVLDHHAEEALTILADMLFHSRFDEMDIRKEKSVILDEIASVEDTPDDDVDERLWSVMYPNQPIGRSIGGIEKTIESFDKEMIERYLSKYYTPENVIISIAGNYDDSLIGFIEDLFNSFESPSRSTNASEGPVPVFHSGRTSKTKDIEQAHICIGYPGLKLTDERLHDLILLDSIVGGTMSSRMFQKIREEKGLAYSVFSYYSSYLTTGAFVIYGGTGPEHLEEMASTMDQLIDEIVSVGVTEMELHNAKEQLKGSFLLGLESSESRMHRNGKNELILSEHKTLDEVVELIEKVQLENVNAIARETFAHRRAISFIGPKKTVNRIRF
ncbi:insulinase family protein [Sporosarcina sp. ACRSL]|uniref:M16 family metallopeptidase n=1 Tax=Sporosarcina sp. ACRSL TaxID=2918215 RepID=UPI001EF54082|nr:pitrilysin family protein [Sporosarcina sp. ACRSL]MCG7342917.1 insulinase family protein [Sporosarcina sp. ACRSL]